MILSLIYIVIESIVKILPKKLDVNKELKNPVKMLVDGAYFTL